MKYRIIKFLLYLLFFTFFSCSKTDNTSTPTDSGIYFPKVKKIIQNNCYSCHLSTGSWAGRPTMFDSDSDIVRAYSSIKSSVTGPYSFIVKPMPEGSTLSQSDIDIIVNWYNKGGKIGD